MKKVNLILLLTATLLLLSSCGKKTIKGPDEILVDGKVISYSDTLKEVEKKLGEGKPDDDQSVRSGYEYYEYSNDLSILYKEEKKIRVISVRDDDIKTYKNICVGDDIDKILDSFDYVQESGKYCTVLFDGTKEIDYKDKGKGQNKDWISITYFMDEDNEIEKIDILDKEYAMRLK